MSIFDNLPEARWDGFVSRAAGSSDWLPRRHARRFSAISGLTDMALGELILSQFPMLAPSRKTTGEQLHSDEDGCDERRKRKRVSTTNHSSAIIPAYAVADWGVDLDQVEIFRRELDQLRIRMLAAIEQGGEPSAYPRLASALADEPSHVRGARRAPLAEDIVTCAVRTLARMPRD